MVDNINLMVAHLRANLMAQLEYRSAVVIQLIGMVLEDAFLLFFWYLFFSRYPALNGWSLTDIMLLYAVVTGGFGLGTLACGNGFRLASLIAQGDLDYFLILPAPPLIPLLMSKSSLSAWGDIIFGWIVFILAAPPSLPSLVFFIISWIASALILVSFMVLAGSLSFFVGQAETLAQQGLGALIAFGMYPMDIFPMVIKVLLLTVIPAALLGSLPAQAIHGLDPVKLGLLVAAAVLFMLVASAVFRLGLRRYESGNRIGARV